MGVMVFTLWPTSQMVSSCPTDLLPAAAEVLNPLNPLFHTRDGGL